MDGVGDGAEIVVRQKNSPRGLDVGGEDEAGLFALDGGDDFLYWCGGKGCLKRKIMEPSGGKQILMLFAV